MGYKDLPKHELIERAEQVEKSARGRVKTTPTLHEKKKATLTSIRAAVLVQKFKKREQ